MTNRGVTCPRCGGSTPLPHDLRVPTFECAFCHATLQTAAYAGQAAVSADALLGHIGAVVSAPAHAAAHAQAAPRFQGGSSEHRPAQCRACGGAVAVPLDLQVRTFGCPTCGRTHQVDDYVSNDERFRLDMARQVAGNEALRRLQAEGVPCGRCGGRNAVPSDGSVQVPCSFCGAPILLSDHVDASAVARQRLKHGVFALQEQLVAAQKARDRWILTVIVAVVAVALIGLVLVDLLR
jgi:hypothetical protein